MQLQFAPLVVFLRILAPANRYLAAPLKSCSNLLDRRRGRAQTFKTPPAFDPSFC